eukprot:TRINITY_DN10570_c0_g1_i1.p1 TRINITY_DN10570_c0_g1~~TRINITY_DN10570_c0_g1_i1.p1  ORF type:complete len:204 (-),score=0.98 TRINITY_DN10570_c0_g1_i1:507-1094(-)
MGDDHQSHQRQQRPQPLTDEETHNAITIDASTLTPPRHPPQRLEPEVTTAAHHIAFSDSSPTQQTQQFLGGGDVDCASPFSRASSGGARDCSICLAPVSGCSVVVMACLHTFHYECAKVWLSQHDGSCPDCRTKVCVDSFTYPQEVDGDAEFAAAQQAGEDLQQRYDADDLLDVDGGGQQELYRAPPAMTAVRVQ